MREAIVYLDSSGIVERYVEESESKFVKDILARADALQVVSAKMLRAYDY
ncbi:MAG: hypothetical protein QXY91_05115 [Thermoproteota archaeon]